VRSPRDASEAVRGLVIVSGIPGSGKSRLARALGPALGLPVLDKDDILESLFDGLGVGDAEWRSRLSRSADGVLQRVAAGLDRVVLTSWWRHPKGEASTGTPIDWLSEAEGALVEVHCVCDPDVAAARFRSRPRHAGHLDDTKNVDGLPERFATLAKLGPLCIGTLITVDTNGDVDLCSLVDRIWPYLS
jgi:hypothetical protein